MPVPRFTVGFLIWFAAVSLPAVPRAALAVLLVALVLVPYMLSRRSEANGWVATSLAVPLAVAYAMQPSTAAGLLAMPWLTLCAVFAVAAARDGLRALPGIVRLENAAHLLRRAAPVLLALGALFAAFDRFGIAPLGLSPSIVLITAVHFHVLGFGLTTVLAALAQRTVVARAAAYPLLVGIPTTALGFTTSLSVVQWIGAVLVACAGLLTVVALLRGAAALSSWRRAAFVAAGLVLLVGVPMGLAWATTALFGTAFVDFSSMVAIHGTLNTAGTAVALLASPESRS